MVSITTKGQVRFPSKHRNPGQLLCSLSYCSPATTIHKRHAWDWINAFCHPYHSPQSWAIHCFFQYSVPSQLRSFKCLYIQRKCNAATPPGTGPLLPPSHPQNHLFPMLITFFSKAVNVDLDPVGSGTPPSFGRQVCLVTFDAENLHCCKNLQRQNPKGTRHGFLVQTLSMKPIQGFTVSADTKSINCSHCLLLFFVSIWSTVGLPFLLGVGG